MPLPPLKHTWTISSNNVVVGGAGQDQDTAALFCAIVAKLLELGVATVVLCSDGTTVDATNRWTAPGSLPGLADGAPHAWIQLQFPGVMGAGHYQVVVALVNNDGTGAVAAVASAGGFTGGDVSHRPTAVDQEHLLGNDAGMAFAGGAGISGSDNMVFHAWATTDGEHVRVLAYCVDRLVLALQIERISSPSVGWLAPAVARLIPGDGASVEAGLLYADLFKPNPTAPFVGHFTHPVFGEVQVPILFGLTTEACGANAVGQLATAPNGISGEYPLTDVGIYSQSTYVLSMVTTSLAGQHGEIDDCFFGSVATLVTTGGLYPSDASRQFVQVGDMVWPWNGSAMFQTS